MSYTSQSQIEKYLQRSLTSDEVSFLSTLLPAIDSYIDNRTNNTFAQVGETTRVYDGDTRYLDIDNATDITAVAALDNYGTVNYTYTAGQEYTLEPANSNVKNQIIARGCEFPDGEQRIAVTAKFSSYDGAVPSDIQLVATRLAAGVIAEGKNQASSGVASESLEGHSITYDTSKNSIDNIVETDSVVKGILDGHKELLLG